MNLRTHLTTVFSLLLAIGMLTSSPTQLLAQDLGLENLKQTGLAFRSVAKKVSPAVVFIKVEKDVASRGSQYYFSPFGSPFDDDFFRRFFGEPPQRRSPHQEPKKRQEVGQGSGFLITPDGYILTNNHVVGEADRVKVQMLDGREYKAEIVGTDPGSDLAVIKIDESDLPFLHLGNSEQLEVGDWVLAIGNPFGLSHTLTAGVVSAKGRSGIGLNDYEDFIQTDAAINPGNSGGPLVNLEGDVVGINTAIFSRSGGYMGIGFAIPVNMAKKIRDQLIEHGEVKRGRLGVYIQDMTPELAESFGLDKPEGILVTQIVEDSPAEDAGLKRGDIIIALDGDKVNNVSSLRNRISLTAPGTKVRLDIIRDGREKQVKVKIGELDPDAVSFSGGSNKLSRLGFSLQNLRPDIAEHYGLQEQKGVVITEVETGSLAYQAGLKPGDLVLEINQKAVNTVDDAEKILKSMKDKTVLLLINQRGNTKYVVLKPN